ncbi:hypothetical protein CDL12_19272 [Handroanthus impetiginosus]|uniref:C2 domain-containing protein n=1 Tax=Handroanthus impetiginosus TaxID=429701 RepID=A0A2G9GSC1_9LAMI|nr:hypothetical protein CDL12_19272 [Handroanthus impetiginosus]
MEYRTLQITLRYAKDLKKVNFITKMNVYAVVSISGGDKKSKQRTKTPADHDGDANPMWDFPMKFTMEEAALQQNRLTLVIKLICERVLGDRDIGEVHVPIKELLHSPATGGGGPEGKKFVSYQVTKPSGRPKGQLTFSYQFSEKNSSASPLPVSKVYGEAMTAYPVAGPNSVYPLTAPRVYPPPPSYPVMAADGGGGRHYPPPAVYPTAGCPPPEVYPPPPPASGYPPPPDYVYPPRRVPNRNKFGAGLLGGLLIGDMISDPAYYDFGG